MRTAEISELKAKLSAHIQYVKNGEEVLILDGKTPVAMLVAVAPGVNSPRFDEFGEREKRLIAMGILIPPSEPASNPPFTPIPAGDHVISREVIDRLWEEEREDR